MESVWLNITDTVLQPRQAFARLREKPQVWAGLIIFLIVQLAGGIGDRTPLGQAGAGASPIAAAIGWTLGYGAVFLFAPLMFQLSARMFGAKGPYWGMASAFGFTSIPLILQAPIALVASAAGVPWLSSLGQVGLSIWSIVLDVLAIAAIYSVKTGRAIGIFIVGFLITVLAVMLIAIVAGVFIGLLGVLSGIGLTP